MAVFLLDYLPRVPDLVFFGWGGGVGWMVRVRVVFFKKFYIVVGLICIFVS